MSTPELAVRDALIAVIGGAAHGLLRIAEAEGAAFVGGWVRDQLAGRASDDVDLAAVDPDHFVQCLGSISRKAVLLDAERRTWRVIFKRGFIDVARWKGADLESDLAARDLAVNAIAWIPGRGLVDPLDGAGDLERGVLRLAGPRALLDDPLRALRLWRIALMLDAQPADDALAALDGLDLSAIAGERVVTELRRILVHPRAQEALSSLQAHGVLEQILPGPVALDHLGPTAPGSDTLDPDESARSALARCWRHVSDLDPVDGPSAVILGRILPARGLAGALAARRWPRRVGPWAAAVASEVGDPGDASDPAARARLLVAWKRNTAFALLGRAAVGRSDAAACLAQLDGAAGFRKPGRAAVPPLPAALLGGREVKRILGVRGPEVGEAVEALLLAQLSGAVRDEESARVWISQRARGSAAPDGA
jgi:poly(A) polymerase